MIYLDSSALVKLALAEPESAALAAWLAERADQALVSSALHRTEVLRAIWRAEPGALPRGQRMIRRIGRVALSYDVLDNAATLPPGGLAPPGPSTSRRRWPSGGTWRRSSPTTSPCSTPRGTPGSR